MKQISIAILLCLCTLAGFAQGGQPLDLKDIVSGKFRAENIYGVIPIPGDGEHYSQMLLPHANVRLKRLTATVFHLTAANCLLLQNRLRFIAALIQLYIIYIV